MKNLILLSLFVLSLASCSKDDDSSTGGGTENTVGRFDNTPFKWDKDNTSFFNTNSTFVGDLSLSFFLSGNITVDSPIIYPGEVFPYNSVNNLTLDAEIKRYKKPYYLTFEFSRPLVFEEIDDKGTLSSYSNYLSQAVTSQNYNDYINRGYAGINSYSATECLTYKDVKKAFHYNTELAEAFTTKMSENKKNNKSKSIYLIRIVETSFGVIFDSNIDGFFRDENQNKNLSEYYIKRIIYGKLMYIAIESEYPYSKVRTCIERTLSTWGTGNGIEYDNETAEILSKSSITVVGVNGDRKNTFSWGVSFDELYSFTQTRFNSNFYGVPVYAEIRSIDGDKVFRPSLTSLN